MNVVPPSPFRHQRVPASSPGRRLRQDHAVDPQRFAHRPRLKRAAARRVRGVAVGHLRHVRQAGLVQVREQRSQEAPARLALRLASCPRARAPTRRRTRPTGTARRCPGDRRRRAAGRRRRSGDGSRDAPGAACANRAAWTGAPRPHRRLGARGRPRAAGTAARRPPGSGSDGRSSPSFPGHGRRPPRRTDSRALRSRSAAGRLPEPWRASVREGAAEAFGDAQRIDPQRLDLDRLADARRDHPVAHLRVHPRQLHAGLAGSEEAVGVGADAETRPARVPVRMAPKAAWSFLRSPRRHGRACRGGRREVFVHRDQIPQRCVDRVELRRLVGIREEVRQHAFRHRPGPLRPGSAPRRRSRFVARHRPRRAMNVSRPQSVNHGYPATMVWPSPRRTR